jgi:hypothetical protein
MNDIISDLLTVAVYTAVWFIQGLILFTIIGAL